MSSSSLLTTFHPETSLSEPLDFVTCSLSLWTVIPHNLHCYPEMIRSFMVAMFLSSTEEVSLLECIPKYTAKEKKYTEGKLLFFKIY